MHPFPDRVDWEVKRKTITYVVVFLLLAYIFLLLKTRCMSMHEFRQVLRREPDLLFCECWDQGERVALRELTNDKLWFDPLFVYDTARQGMDVYYDFTDPYQDPEAYLQAVESHQVLDFNKQAFLPILQSLEASTTYEQSDTTSIFSAIVAAWPFITLGQLYGDTQRWQTSDELLEFCIFVREKTDIPLRAAVSHLRELLFQLPDAQAVPDKLRKFVTYSEYTSGHVPTEEELTLRAERFLFHAGSVTTNRATYLETHNLHLTRLEVISDERSDSLVIKGQCAFPGDVRGRVRVISSPSDMHLMEDGCVLVAPMTTPDLLPIMKKASAIVTDEGGMTCHAAIAARELRIPCVVGTRQATQELVNSELVHVDATGGIVKRINT